MTQESEERICLLMAEQYEKKMQQSDTNLEYLRNKAQMEYWLNQACKSNAGETK